MKVVRHIIDEEGIHFFYLNEYQTKYFMIRSGNFQNRSLVSIRLEEPNQYSEVDLLLIHEESAADLTIQVSGAVSEELSQWAQNNSGQRYYILGAFFPEKLLNALDQELEGYVKANELPRDVFKELFEIIHSYMRNPMNFRIGIQ